MTNPHHDRNVRAGDADRDQVAEVLRDHHAAGRLDSDEMQQRIDACYEAKTIGDLQAVLQDLPRLEQREDAGRASAEGFLSGLGFGFGRRYLPRLWPVLIGLIALSIATGHFIWFAIPLVFLATRRLAPWCRGRPDGGTRWT